MQEYIPGENTLFEVIPSDTGKTVIIYLSRMGDQFRQSSKCFGNYYLEQVFNKNNQVISETIKENPHYLEDPYNTNIEHLY